MKQKCIFITGGAIRIGRQISLYFAEKGWKVGIQYNTSQKEAFQLRDDYGIVPFSMQFNQERSYLSFVDHVYEALGSIDVFVHNASHFFRDNIQTCTTTSWNEHFEINLRAPFVLSQAYIQKKSPESKNIIFMLDQRVWSLTHDFMSYTLTKSALWTLTQTLALAAAPHVRVNGIGPGPVLKDQYLSEEQFQRQYTKTPLQKPVDCLDIAKAIEFIVHTPSMTGQMLALDSGQHLRGY